MPISKLRKESGVPHGLPATLPAHLWDDWDPAVVRTAWAKDRPVVLLTTPPDRSLRWRNTLTTIAEIGPRRSGGFGALGLRQIDLLGFSIGGFVAQQVTLGPS